MVRENRDIVIAYGISMGSFRTGQVYCYMGLYISGQKVTKTRPSIESLLYSIHKINHP